MTREELKEHCKKQIEMCEMWAIAKGKEPSGKVYEEHKMVLDLLEALEQEPILDKIRAEINTMSGDIETIADMLAIIDKYKTESEEKENTIKYYLVCNDEGSGYGGFDTLEKAIDSLNTHDFLNNDDGSYNHIEMVTEIHEEVYRKE